MAIPKRQGYISPPAAGGEYMGPGDVAALNAPSVAGARLAGAVAEGVTDYANRQIAIEGQLAHADARIAAAARQTEAAKWQARATVDLATEAEKLANTVDPSKVDEAYTELAEATRQKYIQQISDPQLQKEFTGRFDVWAENARLNVRHGVRQRQIATAKATLGETLQTWQNAALLAKTPAERQAAMQSGYKAIDDAAAAGLVTAEGAAAMRQSFNGDADLAFARQAIEADPAGAMQRLKSGEWEAIDANRRQSLIEGASREIEQRTRQAEIDARQTNLQRKAEADQEYADLYTLVERGQAGQREIDAFDQRYGDIAPLKTKTLNSVLTGRMERQERETDRLAVVQQAIEGGAGRNVSQADVDLYWEKIAGPQMQAEGASMAPLTTLVARTGRLPRQVREGYERQIRYASPQDRAQAAAQIVWLQEHVPAAFGELPDDTRRTALLFNEYLQSGATPSEASERVDQQLTAPDAMRRARAEYLRQGQVGQKPSDLAWQAAVVEMRRSTGGWLGFGKTSEGLVGDEPGAIQARADFDRFFQPAFEATGDLRAARAEAVAYMRRTWGVTDVDGGRRWMKYAPETMYQAPADVLAADLDRQSKALPAPPTGRLVVMSDSRTAAEAPTGSPSYAVLMMADDGVLHPVAGPDGEPWRWRPAPHEAPPSKMSAADVQRLREARAPADYSVPFGTFSP